MSITIVFFHFIVIVVNLFAQNRLSEILQLVFFDIDSKMIINDNKYYFVRINNAAKIQKN